MHACIVATEIGQFDLFWPDVLSLPLPEGRDGLPQRLKRERTYQALIEELIRRRKKARISQVLVAKAVKTDQSQISKYERFERELGIVDFVRYCRAIGADPRDLLRLLDK